MNVAFSDTMTAALQAVEEEWGTWLNQIQETQTELLNLVNTINDWNRLIHYAGDTTGNNAISLLSTDEVLNSSLNPNIL